MSEFRGTLGEWSAFYGSNGTLILNDEDECIASIGGRETTHEENDFNAKLIAAAPHMLEALKRAQAQFWQAGIKADANSLNPIEELAARIDVVISKALGQ
ncbi:hypothetical protein HX773_19095 [Pantoea sp. B9002]|uniref:hypothetical protein n=1 Tax=Pantoea sp. B9002 TaxID=2726979 RepID=UPI0015A3EEFD|nr:hypothetical protein [Pantoea sp. B9002]NWA63016.1 hypothetical protein [Pantoea sp. B9002]